MKIETVLWLFPIVFMFHDFEEIVMLKPWMVKNANGLRVHFPRLAARVLPHFENLSTSAFALAAAEEFVLLSVLTYFSVEYGLYSVWAGVLLGFSFHLVVHLVQFLVFRKYVPVIITSVLSMFYCFFALDYLNTRNLIVWRDVRIWTVVAIIVLGVNLTFVHWLVSRFERFLNETYLP